MRFLQVIKVHTKQTPKMQVGLVSGLGVALGMELEELEGLVEGFIIIGKLIKNGANITLEPLKYACPFLRGRGDRTHHIHKNIHTQNSRY